ncbi:hypothetical protein TWF718_011116 [Orbilia javanica]|uniref:Protein kinase domain-containing protein n=1 Tax=Orbilia javanica TaxID=47235 RepID=A0AAN8MR97_9PEZI
MKRARILTTMRTTNPTHPREFLADITRWESIYDDIEKLLSPYLAIDFDDLDRALGTFEWGKEDLDFCHNEKDVVDFGAFAYEDTVVAILRICFQIHGKFKDHQATCNIGDPDRVFFIKGGNKPPKAEFMVEWKTPWGLRMTGDLVEEFNNNRDTPGNKLVKAISQIYGYISFNNLQFGALCNYEALYLLRRDGDLGLQVSPPFKYSDKGVRSPVAALTYICHHVAKTSSFYYSPIEQGPKGINILRIHDFDVKGSWDSGLKVPWDKMNLYLMGQGRKNVATVVSGEVRHQLASGFRYKKAAFFKVYDITTPQNLKAADKEILAYEKLKALQGKYIPKLYAAGVYHKTLKILVLEDCGETAHSGNLGPEFWKEAEEALLALHKFGAIHGDVKLDNFAISSSGVMLIDLGACRQGAPRDINSELEEFKALKNYETARKEEDEGEPEE